MTEENPVYILKDPPKTPYCSDDTLHVRDREEEGESRYQFCSVERVEEYPP